MFIFVFNSVEFYVMRLNPMFNIIALWSNRPFHASLLAKALLLCTAFFFSIINLISECSLYFWHLLRTGSKDSVCCVIIKGSWYNIRARRKMCNADYMFSRLFIVSVMSSALQLNIYFLVIHICSLVMRLHWKIFF